VFPPTIVQTCIVHLIGNSMDFASWKDRKPIAAELKAIYRATDTIRWRQRVSDERSKVSLCWKNSSPQKSW
jgi:transposase-like protein